MNIILFGPPGIGKSTIIGELKTRGAKAIDLEDLYPNRVRFQIPSQVSKTVIGAADLNPKRKYRNALKVLLYAPQNVYDARRAIRDAKQPGKGSQPQHDVKQWEPWAEYWFDVINTNRFKDAGEVADFIIHEMKEGGLYDV